MSLGIGASSPDKGYLGLVRDQLAAYDNQPWQMVNLGQWGDKLSHGIDRQLPALTGIRQPDHVLICIGSNDMVWGASLGKLRRGIRAIAEAVPAPAQVCTLIGSSPRSIIANKSLIKIASETGHEIVNPWFKWRGKQASDRFHPNDEGYLLMSLNHNQLSPTAKFFR
jgi:acyl-CoA thioesterase-1